jgi:hypothetical protein
LAIGRRLIGMKRLFFFRLDISFGRRIAELRSSRRFLASRH